jgi:Methyltransferase domain
VVSEWEVGLVSSTATEESRATSDGGSGVRLRTLFFLQGSEYLAAFQSLVLALLGRGHEVVVALDHERRGIVPEATRTLSQLAEGNPGFRYQELPPRRDLWRIPAGAVRRSLDYLRYLEPELAQDAALRASARERAPRLLLALLALPPFRWSWGRRLLAAALRRIEAGMPVPRWVRSFVAEQRPDVVLVSPLVDFGSGQADYVRRAQAQRIPTVLLVAGPDDLRAKGAIRDAPTVTVVTSAAQAEEAVRFQGLPPDGVITVPGTPDAPAEAGVVEAIERTAPSPVVPNHRGMLLRPIFLVLTPLLACLLPLLRPRASARGAVKWGRDRRRVRMHKRREEQARAAVQAKERARAARIEAKTGAARAKREAAAAAKATKQPERQEAVTEKERERTPAAEARKAEKAAAGAANEEAEAKVETEKTEPPKTKAREAGAKQAATPMRKRTRRARGRIAKQARGRARAVRRGFKGARRSVRRTYNRRYRFTYVKKITRVPARDELPALLNARGLLGKGVEIGVKTGKYSDELLRNWRGEQLISVDPWLSVDWDEYVDRSNVSQDEFDRYYQMTRERLAPYGERSDIWRMTSVEAAKRVPDHSLDFAYIDARHDYESVKEDIAAWCAKVRPGGILAGHDYVDGDFPEGEFYVKSAVDEFFGERGIHVHGTEGPSAVESFPTWIVEVPEEGIEPPAQ